jgi:hypothetical protein
MAYQIGSRSFDDLKGNIVVPSPMFDSESRIGQDGSVVFATGNRGKPFSLESMYVETSYANAQALAITYASEPSLTPRNIIRGTVDFTATTIRFVVLGVRTEIQPVPSWQGARGVASPGFVLRAEWQLLAVNV